MNVCNETSSVKIVCADVAPVPPYGPEVCVVEGLSFDNRNRACDPPASQTINRGSGKRSVIKSYVSMCQRQSPSARSDLTNSGIFFGLLEERCEILVAFLVLISRLPPLRNSFAMEDQNMEKCVEKQHVRGLNGCGIQ